MENKCFKALVVTEGQDGKFSRSIQERNIEDLPSGEVVVEVHYSSLNYKDALSASGNKGVTRKYPHTPGIDASGIVVESKDGNINVGDEVIVTSYDLGMNTDGGFGGYIRVPAGWVVPLPKGMTLREAMCYGTAGFTAGLSVFKLVEPGITPDMGDVLVSGATGGVGGIALSILARLGFSVTAVNGAAADQSYYLKSIGAKDVISIEEASDKSGRPLLKTRWAGSIDAVGGEILATTIKSVHPNGVVTSCGNVASPELPLNVFPFILRGVTLAGIDSQNCPMPLRVQIWNKLADEWKIPSMESVINEIGLSDLDGQIDLMLKRGRKGRSVVNIKDYE